VGLRAGTHSGPSLVRQAPGARLSLGEEGGHPRFVVGEKGAIPGLLGHPGGRAAIPGLLGSSAIPAGSSASSAIPGLLQGSGLGSKEPGLGWVGLGWVGESGAKR